MSTDRPQTFSFTATPEEHGERLDRVVTARLAAAHLGDVSRSRVQKLIDGGLVTCNGAASRSSDRVSTGDSVHAVVPEDDSAESLTADANLPLQVIYVDDTVVVIDKPAGQVVHPAAGHADDTLVNALIARYPALDTAFDDNRPGLVHRLDRDTTGLLVVARTEAAAENLRQQFKLRTVEKSYVALVKGSVTPPEGVIDAPVGRDRKRRKQMAAVAGGREAQTAYTVLDTSGNYSLVEARPRTGRTHQIRVHLAAIGYPVAGDTVYGKRDKRMPRLALHAYRLSFDHPTTGERMTFEAPLPDDLVQAMHELGMRLPEA